MGMCCVAQETQTGALYQPRGVGWGGRWEGGSKGKGYMYTCGWSMLRFERKQQNSVKKWSFSKIIKRKKTKTNKNIQLKALKSFRWMHFASFKFRLIWNSSKNHLMWSCLFASRDKYTCNLHMWKMAKVIPCHFPLYYHFLSVCVYTHSLWIPKVWCLKVALVW